MNSLQSLLQFITNMSRFSKIIIFAAAALMAVSCGKTASINGTLASAPSSEVIVKLLDVNRYEVLDTVATDAAGKFNCKVALEDGQPEFVYLFYKDKKIASLLLEAGDKVNVEADTLGGYAVTGSEESVKLAQVEKDYADALAKLNALAVEMGAASDAEEALQLRRELGQAYVDYYRDRVKYILANSTSLTVVPVLYQNFGENLPVFGQSTDAIHFVNTADSLATVYPDSKYVKALKKEAERRFGYMELEARINSADEVGYVDIELPDVTGKKVKLSDVDSKVVLLYFWSASDASQKMFNLDFLKTVYEDYHDRGFEIYQVSLDPDKASWAQVVKKQELPWINVCDTRASASPYVATYNIAAVPAAYVISDGALVDGQAVDEKSFRALLTRLLK